MSQNQDQASILVTGNTSIVTPQLEAQTFLITMDRSRYEEPFGLNKTRPHGWYRQFVKQSVFKRR